MSAPTGSVSAAAEYANRAWRDETLAVWLASKGNTDLQAWIVGYPDAHPKVYEQATRSRSTRVLVALAASPGCPPRLLARLARRSDDKIASAALANPATPASTKHAALRDIEYSVWAAAQILKDPNAAPDLVAACAALPDPPTKVYRHANLPATERSNLITAHVNPLPGPRSRRLARLGVLCRNPALTPDEISQLLTSTDPRIHRLIRWNLTANPAVDATFLDANWLPDEKDASWAAQIANNPSTAPATLARIAAGRSWPDRAVANPHCPPSTVLWAAELPAGHTCFRAAASNPALPDQAAFRIAERLLTEEWTARSREILRLLLTNPATPAEVLTRLIPAAQPEDLPTAATHPNATCTILDLIPAAVLAAPAYPTRFQVAGRHLSSTAAAEVALSIWPTWDGSVTALFTAAEILTDRASASTTASAATM